MAKKRAAAGWKGSRRTAKPKSAEDARWRELLFSFLVPIGTVLFVLTSMEIVLHFLPVSSGVRAVTVTSDNPVFHFTPNRAFLHSLGWDMHNINRGHINNAGFVNDYDYHRDDPLSLLAVVGDSYIEARMVPFADTVQGRLSRMLNGRSRVYSFAAAGAPLSQYLIWAQHAVRAYGASTLVINIVGNDFDESLITYKAMPGFWHYAPDELGELRLRLVEHRPGWVKELARESALARYIVMNLKLHEVMNVWIFSAPAKAAPRYAGNTDADANAARVNASRAVIDAFFRDLPGMTGLPPESVLFTLDGFRYPHAAQAGRGTYFDLMRRAFLEKARGLGYEVIDLDDRFIPSHLRSGERFEFRTTVIGAASAMELPRKRWHHHKH
jgi:hypothetical protein